jgi:putative FmdB family regulatory protein
MAFYDFVCQDCGEAFEVFTQGFIKDGDKECPSCHSTNVGQKFTSFLHSGSTGGGCSAPAGSPFG